ncbi:MAG: hypothetical protein ACJ77M_12300 [Thermoleophilaceae bacterium]
MGLRHVLRLLLATVALTLALAASAEAAPAVFGVNNLWPFNDNGLLGREVALSQQLGVQSDRIIIEWGVLEPKRNQFAWSSLDGYYRAMDALGVRPLIDLVGSPAWAREQGCGLSRCPQAPQFDDEYQSFVRAMVNRYPHLAGVEVMNEPNLTEWWPHPDPERYAQILKAAYAGVKSANPNVPVVTAGLSPNGAISPGQFLNEAYDAGIKGHFDKIGFHVYVGGTLASVAPDVKTEMSTVRNVRDEHGDSSPFWITETGFPSEGASQYSSAVYSEDMQAQMLSVDYKVLSSMPDVEGVFVFLLSDLPSWAGTQKMGLYRSDLTPKPAVDAFNDARANPFWPTYNMTVAAPAAPMKSSQWFTLQANGYTGSGAVQYEWLIWHTDHWSLPIGRTSTPTFRFHIYRGGVWRFAVRLVTDSDVYLSSPIAVTVKAPVHSRFYLEGKANKSKKKKTAKPKRKKKKKAKAKRKRVRRAHARLLGARL